MLHRNKGIGWNFFLNNRGEADGKSGDEAAMAAMKTELEGLKADKSKLEKDLEDTRMEVLTPEYSAFLESLEKKAAPKDEKKEDAGDDFEKLSKKEVFERAKNAALDEFNKTLKNQRDETKKEQDARTKREIATFSKTHEDFEKYRPVMYGLSLKPENADVSLAHLYDLAKGHVAELAGTTEAQKKQQQKMASEKPGGDSASMEKLRKMSHDQIAREALEEVKKELGPIPAA